MSLAGIGINLYYNIYYINVGIYKKPWRLEIAAIQTKSVRGLGKFKIHARFACVVVTSSRLNFLNNN